MSRSTSLAPFVLIAVLAACNSKDKPPTVTASPAAAATPSAGSAVAPSGTTVAAGSGAVAGATPPVAGFQLPGTLPELPTCLAVLRDGTGAVVATSNEVDGDKTVAVSLVMADGAKLPTDEHLFEAAADQAAAAWTSGRGAVEGKLATLALAPCQEVSHGADEPAWGFSRDKAMVTVEESWKKVKGDDTRYGKIKISVDGRAREFGDLLNAPGDGARHESIDSVFTSADGATVVVFVVNNDTALVAYQAFVTAAR